MLLPSDSLKITSTHPSSGGPGSGTLIQDVNPITQEPLERQPSEGSWTNLVATAGAAEEDEKEWKALEGYERWRISLKELYLGRRFATGTYGRLYQGVYQTQEVAAKILRQPSDPEEAKHLMKQFEQEVSMLAMLSHPNVVKMVGACHKSSVWCIVMEYLSGGNLRSFLGNRDEPLPPLSVVSMALDIAHGMEYLHSQGVIHRDLKSDNIVFAGNGTLKITDFGVARLAGAPVDMTAETGTYRWMAPEMINHQPYTAKVDVYSFGIVLWELITGDQPFKGMTAVQAAFAVVNKNMRPPVPDKALAVLGELMQQCWQANAERRPDFTQIVATLKQVQRELLHNPEKLRSVESIKRQVTRCVDGCHIL